jgi:hypothetical protein
MSKISLTKSQSEFILWLTATVVLSGVVIWVRIETVKNTYLYVQREKELQRLEVQLQSEKVRWLKMTHPSRLEVLAKQLNMVAPKLSQYRKVTSLE